MIRGIRNRFEGFLANPHFKEVFKGGVITFGAKICTLLLGFFTTWFISTRYGADALGQLSLLSSLVSMIIIFTVMGLNNSLLRLVPEYLQKYSYGSALLVFRKSAVLVGIAGIFAALLYAMFHLEIATRIFHKGELAWLFLLASPLIFVQSLFNVNIAFIQAMKKIRMLTFFQLFQPLLFTVAVVGGTWVAGGKNLPVYAQAFVNVTLLAVSAVVIYKSFCTKRQRTDGYKGIGGSELLAMSLPMMMTGVFTAVLFQTDTIMLGMFKTVEDVGVYAVVMKIAGFSSFFLVAINTIAAPKFSELYHGGKMDDLQHVARQSSKVLVIISLLITLLLVLFGKGVLGFFGGDFTLGYTALLFILFGQLINAWTGSVGHLLNMTGHQKLLQYIVLAAAILNVALNYFLIQAYGLLGAAVASMVSMVFINSAASYAVYRKLNVTVIYIPWGKR